MNEKPLTANKILPINRRQILLSLIFIGYGVIFGEVYSYVHFSLWLVTHLLVTIGLSVGLLWPALRQKKWPGTATVIDGPLLALGLIMAVSTLLSPWPRLALEGLFTWLSHVLAFYLVVRLMRHNWSDSLLRALMLVTGVVILISLFELAAWYFGVPFVPQFSQGWWEIGGLTNPIPPIWYRLSFMLNNPVVLSAYLVLLIPLAFAFLFTTRRPSDQLLVGLFVIITLIVFNFTFSRGGWLGVAAGIASMTGLWLWRNYNRFSPRQRSIIISKLGLANLVVIGGIIYLIWVFWGSRSGSNTERIAYWQAALYLYHENPIWGIGPGLFRWGWRLSPFALEIRDIVVTAHNLYLNQLAELGTTGGLAGLWLLSGAGITFWRVLNNTKDSRLWWRRAGCVAGLVGFLVQGLFETFPIWPIAIPVIILSAYLIFPYNEQSQAARFFKGNQKHGPSYAYLIAIKRGINASSPYAGAVLAVMWFLCAISISYFAIPKALAEKARSAAANNQNEQAIALIEQSVRMDPKFALYQFEAAGWYVLPDIADYQTARMMYQTALNLESSYGLNHANLATIEWHLGNHDVAISHITTASQLAPKTPQFWLTLGVYSEEQGDYEQALSAYSQAIVTNPNWINSDFWQATSWRRENFTALFEHACAELSPLQCSQLNFQFQLQTRNLAEAEKALGDISQYDPDGYFYHFAAGELHLAQNKLKLALEHIQQAIQLQANNSQAYALQAEILFELGNLDQAQQTIKRAIFLGQNSTTKPYYILGRIKEAQELFSEAEAAYWRGYNPQTFSLNYSVALYRQLSSLLPLPTLQRTSGGPITAQAWFDLADLYKRQGRFQQAIQIYNLLLSEDPFLNQAKVELAKLCQKNQTWCSKTTTFQ